jgi:hypothetical protein
MGAFNKSHQFQPERFSDRSKCRAGINPKVTKPGRLATGRGGDSGGSVVDLTICSESDILSDVKTFNVRELSRSTAKVLAACELDGGVIIRYEDGRQFELMPRRPPRDGSQPSPDFAKRTRTIFGKRRFTRRQINALFEAAKGRD